MKLFVLVLTALAGAAWGGRIQRAPGEAERAGQELAVHREASRDCKSKCATNIASKAAAEAKAAQDAQNSAGAQAAHQVKTQLAERALQAAKAAEAALAGKQAVVEQLQQELKEAEAVVAESSANVHQQQALVNAAMQAAQQAAAMHKLLCQVTQLAAATDKSTKAVLDKIKVAMAGLLHGTEEARKRAACLQKKLTCECSEMNQIKQSAKCACEAARVACENAKCKRSDEFKKMNVP